MNSSLKIIWAVMGLFVVLGVILLGFWDIPAPSAEVRKEVAVDVQRP
ncbi:MAG: hypothetical protein ACK5O7_05320 [Holosporales bacterium]